MPRIEELRQKYPVFRYDSFSIEPHANGWVARFRYTVPPDISFTPEVFFTTPSDFQPGRSPYLDNAIFHLGLIEALSYWKATASPVIEVHAGALSEEQTAWWEDLLLHGMGEYFFVNDIDFTKPNFVRIQPTVSGEFGVAYSEPLPDRSLLTIGGGRDSALAGALLKNSDLEFNCMMLNPSVAANRIAAKVARTQPVVVRRAICPELLELNQKGFLNGHTPFSAYLGFLGAACLLIHGYRNIIVSNERSSDEGNVHYRGQEINHQYSKSLRFEERFDEYLRRYLAKSARYFSFVRPLYELQIGKLFSRFPEFFSEFRSCNRNQKKDNWCGECPKCVSVYLTMYPFVDRGQLLTIFGADLFEKESTIPILRGLAGLERNKPFECVATTREIAAALALSAAKVRQAGTPTPLVLRYALENVPGVDAVNPYGDILNGLGVHRMPFAFETLLKSV